MGGTFFSSSWAARTLATPTCICNHTKIIEKTNENQNANKKNCMKKAMVPSWRAFQGTSPAHNSFL